MEEGAQLDNAPRVRGGLLIFKRGHNVSASPISPLSPESQGCESSIDLAFDEALANNNLEELYRNVYEMKSSNNSSPSICSFTTYGNESRIDAELRHLVGADEAVEVPKGREKSEKRKKKGHSVTSSSSTAPPRSPSIGKMSKTKKPVKASSNQVPVKAMSFSSREGGGKTTPREKSLIARSRSLKSFRKPSQDGVLSNVDTIEMRFTSPDLGPYLLKKAKDVISSGDNLDKAFSLLFRAKKSFEKHIDEKKPNLDFVLCLHFLASMYCSSGKYEEAIPLLRRSTEIPVVEMGQDHALAKFIGIMQLGDIYALLGQIENSINLYKTGLEIQRAAIGEKDARFGETCRYVAEAHVQALRFDEAGKLCEMALNTHKENSSPRALVSIEEASDRRLMGLICDSRGDHEAALEHYGRASLAASSHGQDFSSAAVQCNIGDAYLALSRYDEAVCSYRKALEGFKLSKGVKHPSVGSVFVRLAELYNKMGKFGKSKFNCEKALKIYNKPPPGAPSDDIANGFTDLASIFESMNELERAVELLQRALKIYTSHEGSNREGMIAGIEAQMGVMYYMLGKYSNSYGSLKDAASRFHSCGEKSVLYGMTLNQMGLACVQLGAITEASMLFGEAKEVLEKEYGLYHPETLGVYSNLVGTYDALGRWDEAIEILDFVVSVREERLGTADPIVDDEKQRLSELLKEAGRTRNRKLGPLENLIDEY